MASDYITCWVDPMIGAYLDDLVRVGTHGEDRDSVVRTLISSGVQRAIEGHLIPLRRRETEEAPQPAPARVPADGKPPCATCDDGLDVKGDVCADCGRLWESPF